MIITLIVLIIAMIALVMCAIPLMFMETLGWIVIAAVVTIALIIFISIIEIICYPFRMFGKYLMIPFMRSTRKKKKRIKG